MIRISLAFAGLCLAMATAPVAAAAEPPVQVASSDAAAPFGGVPVVPDAVLSGTRAMADVSLIDQIASVRNSSTVADNSITGDFQTGLVSIASDAFNGMTGLTLFNINTGNNVAINASMNVNVAIQP